MDRNTWLRRSLNWQALGCFCGVLMSLAASAQAQSPLGAVLTVPRSGQSDEDLVHTLNGSLVVTRLYLNSNSAVATYSFALPGGQSTSKNIQVRLPAGWLNQMSRLNRTAAVNNSGFSELTPGSDPTTVSVSQQQGNFISGPSGTVFYLIPLLQLDAFVRGNGNTWPDWEGPVHITQDMELVGYNPPVANRIVLTDGARFDARPFNTGIATTTLELAVVGAPALAETTVFNTNVGGPAVVANPNTQPPSSLSFRLTDSVPYESGAVWFSDRQDVAGGFVTTFQFQMTELDSLRPDIPKGADGFAFVIQNFSPSPLGLGGGFLGYHGIPDSLAVEFDTYWNMEPGFFDPDGNHISVHTRGTAPNSVSELASIGRTSAIPDLHDGARHLVQILYQPGALSIYLDDLQFPVLVVNRGPDGNLLDLPTLLALPDGQAWLGFTAGTGAAFQTHDIISWNFRVLPNSPF